MIRRQALGLIGAAALAACVDLRLHDPHRTTELLGGLDGLLHGERRIAAGHWNAELAQDLFALVFVDLHGRAGFEGGWFESKKSDGSAPARGRHGAGGTPGKADRL